MSEGKECIKCGMFKDISGFYTNKTSKSGYHNACKKCRKEYAKKYQKKNMRKVRNRAYLSRYGISIEEYETLYEKQKGCCSICGTSNSTGKLKYAKLFVDHCHNRDEVRGLLCKSCNIGLGEFKDDVSLLQKAIEYLNGQHN